MMRVGFCLFMLSCSASLFAQATNNTTPTNIPAATTQTPAATNPPATTTPPVTQPPATTDQPSQQLPRKAIGPSFSDFQGRLSWAQAVKKCAELKMRLPAVYELIQAFDQKVANTWEPKGWYWSSTEDPDTSVAFIMLTTWGRQDVEMKGYTNYVRCVK